jgi:hypothetical protein
MDGWMIELGLAAGVWIRFCCPFQGERGVSIVTNGREFVGRLYDYYSSPVSRNYSR